MGKLLDLLSFCFLICETDIPIYVCLTRSVRRFSSLSGSSSLWLASKPIFSPLNCRFHQDRYPINMSLPLKQELKKCLLNKVLLEHHSQV